MLQKVGFIMGGQLARMMLQALPALAGDFETFVLDPNPENACKDLADHVIVGASTDYRAVFDFGQMVDVIILEFENVNLEALKELEASGKTVICQPAHLEIIQNKGTQKQFFLDNNLPTAPFVTVQNRSDLENLDLDFPKIQKSFLGGYDGGGVKKLSNVSDIENAFDVPSVIEDCVKIEKEFSLLLARDMQGRTMQYPLVEQFFDPENHIVEFIVSPAELPGNLQSQVDQIAETFLQVFTGPGFWAVELFLDDQGQILVNEIAPRVHNSGHHSIEGNQTSQFEQCLRVALGLELGPAKATGPTITMNLLGAPGHTGKAVCTGLAEIKSTDGAYLHLYGKGETKPLRKMGHLTVTADSIEAAWDKIKTLKPLVRIEAE